MTETKLYRVGVALGAEGFKTTIIEWDILKEGPKTYHIKTIDKWGEPLEKHKKKQEIAIISGGIWLDTIGFISKVTWAFKKDIPLLEERMKEQITTLALNNLKTAEKIVAALSVEKAVI